MAKVKIGHTCAFHPVPWKQGEIKIPHWRSIDLEQQELLSPLLIVIGNIFYDVTTRARIYKKGPGTLFIPLHQHELTKFIETEREPFFSSPNQECHKVSQEIGAYLSER